MCFEKDIDDYKLVKKHYGFTASLEQSKRKNMIFTFQYSKTF